MKFEIKSRLTGEVLFSAEADSSKLAVEAAVKSGADLSGANLSYVNLSGADLSGANLSGANLSGANLSYANLSRADLSGANLSYANLSYANLSYASLSRADLSGAYLYRAKISHANLSYASLSRADLSGAQLPSPTALLLASWGELSEKLTADLMVFDSLAHPDPEAFTRWAKGGPCPYEGVNIQRAANFKEKKELWGKGEPDTIYNLMVRVLKEKTKTDL
jgi:hypothetical protein